MAAIKQILINTFDTIAEDKRDLPNGQFRYLENLDIGNFNRSARQITNISLTTQDQCIIKLLRYGNDVYGLGWTGVSAKDVCLYKYNFTTKVYDVLTTSTVAGTMTNIGPLFAIMNGIIYFDGGNGKVCTYVLASNTLNTNFATPTGSVSGGTSWQGSLYGWDDTDNDIRLIDKTTPAWTSMIVIPKTQTIKELIPVGNYLYIICTASTISQDGVSKMYIWDGVTTTTFTDIVDIGYGPVAGGDILDGVVYAVIGFANNKGFRIKAYSGGIFQTVYTYFSRDNPSSVYAYCMPLSTVKAYTGFLYFIIAGGRPGATFDEINNGCLFRYGRKNNNESNKLSVYKTLEVTLYPNAPGITSINDFIIYENYTQLSAQYDNYVFAVLWDANSGGVLATTKQAVSMSSTWSAQPGLIETSILTGGDSATTKHFKVLAIHHAPLTTGQSVAVYYKKDAELSWTLTGTSDTVGEVHYPINNIEGSGASLNFNEISFRLEVLGGAEVTSFRFKFEEEDDIYQ